MPLEGDDVQGVAKPRLRRGMVMLYLIVALTAMIAFCSLAVDFGRVQVAKSQLHVAVDAAARYGTFGLSNGTAASKAIAVAAQNNIDGTSLVLQNSDVVTGTWTPGSGFTAGGASPNAVQVTGYRTRARNTAVPLVFAQVIGQTSCDVTATSIAYSIAGAPGGIVGYSGVTVKNNFFVGSYNSAVDTNPTENTAGNSAGIGSNGVIYGKNNNTLQGDAMLGPSASLTGINVSGSTLLQSSALTPPTMPAWSPGTNPGNISQTYSSGSTTTLPGGTYWFTSMTINGDLSFSGPATLYVNGPIDLNAALTAYHSRPANLQIYQIAASTFGDSSSNHMDITAQIFAPNSDFSAKNNFVLRASAFFNTITAKNNADMFYDTAIGPVSGATSITTVK